ncbi:superoxide dismutase family protein [Paenibacillus sp. WST5]|uniref:Superoxide dismutase family protein n=2 Tax=Paenibacillus sedimenti TaxID=2770274 RepID=A0A926KV74_9BACL|nr:superoxide dismutase family protein [Paenibacillus sedimenti]
MKTATTAFLCGALMFSGLSYAASSQHVEVSFDKLSFFIKGDDKTSANGLFDNGGTSVPEALVYEGTTYVPVRKAAELLDQPVYWDNTTRAVSIGNPYIVLYDAKGSRIGHAVLTPGQEGVTITLEVSNLTPGQHGFHIHEKSFEGFDFKTAGGHFNPENKKHGHSNSEGHHLGDLQNLEIGADGKGRLEYLIKGASLDKTSKHSIVGRSLIIHAKADDGKTDPAGDSGDRIAGGVIPQ